MICRLWGSSPQRPCSPSYPCVQTVVAVQQTELPIAYSTRHDRQSAWCTLLETVCPRQFSFTPQEEYITTVLLLSVYHFTPAAAPFDHIGGVAETCHLSVRFLSRACIINTASSPSRINMQLIRELRYLLVLTTRNEKLLYFTLYQYTGWQVGGHNYRPISLDLS